MRPTPSHLSQIDRKFRSSIVHLDARCLFLKHRKHGFLRRAFRSPPLISPPLLLAALPPPAALSDVPPAVVAATLAKGAASLSRAAAPTTATVTRESLCVEQGHLRLLVIRENIEALCAEKGGVNRNDFQVLHSRSDLLRLMQAQNLGRRLVMYTFTGSVPLEHSKHFRRYNGEKVPRFSEPKFDGLSLMPLAQ